jgi:hypothetical protein
MSQEIPRADARPTRRKRCSLCLEWLSASCFSRDRRLPDGLDGRCRACRSEYRLGMRPAKREYRAVKRVLRRAS